MSSSSAGERSGTSFCEVGEALGASSRSDSPRCAAELALWRPPRLPPSWELSCRSDSPRCTEGLTWRRFPKAPSARRSISPISFRAICTASRAESVRSFSNAVSFSGTMAFAASVSSPKTTSFSAMRGSGRSVPFGPGLHSPLASRFSKKRREMSIGVRRYHWIHDATTSSAGSSRNVRQTSSK